MEEVDWIYQKHPGSLSGYWTHPVPQMSKLWFDDRCYRINGGSFKKALDPATMNDVIKTALGDNVIHIDPANNYGIDMEPQARQSYITKYHPQNYWESGLCIPDPHDPFYNFLTHHQRRLLVHLGASPDLCFINNNKFGIVELKCPINQRVYPDVKATQRARSSHYQQMQANCGILGSTVCNYYVYTPSEQLNVSVHLDLLVYRRTITNLLSLIERYIVPYVDLERLSLPTELKDYYLRGG
jgi:hypothetical protein